MSSLTPPSEVLAAILGPTTRVTRRVEIYEQDGKTRWQRDTEIRFIDGNISIDYSRDERRSLDLTLDNSDGTLVNAPGEFWYDKVIKVYRGVEVNQKSRPPKVIIISAASTGDAQAFRAALAEIGFDDVRINLLATTLTDLIGYEVVVSLGGTAAFQKAALLKSAYNEGYRIFTQGPSNAIADLPFATAASASTAFTHWEISPNTSLPSELTTGWLAEEYPGATGYLITGVNATAIPISAVTQNTIVGYSIIAASNTNGQNGEWMHFSPPLQFSANFSAFLDVAFSWLDPFEAITSWEVQIGEFMIDKIDEDHFPRTMKVTGRDYTKKCLNSKFEQALEFDGPNNLETLISAIAANAGITKTVLPTTGVVVNKTFTYDRGTARWAAMKDIANAYSYDIYFDGQGFLRLEPQVDPSTTPPIFTFQTGEFGNMVSYTKSTNDSMLYNHVLVVGGTDTDATALPPSAEAKNTDPNSPTSIAEIGDRLYEYDSDFITTIAQAQKVANSFLAIHSLEQFSLDFESIVLPWLDVGQIVQWVDPNPAPDDPDMFLLQSLSIPLVLGAMSASAGRVVIA